jgi:hypothetical protein
LTKRTDAHFNPQTINEWYMYKRHVLHYAGKRKKEKQKDDGSNEKESYTTNISLQSILPSVLFSSEDPECALL